MLGEELMYLPCGNLIPTSCLLVLNRQQPQLRHDIRNGGAIPGTTDPVKYDELCSELWLVLDERESLTGVENRICRPSKTAA